VRVNGSWIKFLYAFYIIRREIGCYVPYTKIYKSLLIIQIGFCIPYIMSMNLLNMF
jgi:hypothetical protein